MAGSGDNCNSLAGMGIVAAGRGSGGGGGESGSGSGGGDVVVSLGTSDTLLGVTTDPSPTTIGVFIKEIDTPGMFILLLAFSFHAEFVMGR